MLEYPRRPEGPLTAQVQQLFDLIYKIIEEINLKEERDNENH